MLHLTDLQADDRAGLAVLDHQPAGVAKIEAYPRDESEDSLSEFILIGEQRGQLPAQSCGCSEIKYNVVTECCWRWRPSVTPRLTAAVEVGVAKAELLIIYT